MKIFRDFPESFKMSLISMHTIGSAKLLHNCYHTCEGVQEVGELFQREKFAVRNFDRKNEQNEGKITILKF